MYTVKIKKIIFS